MVAYDTIHTWRQENNVIVVKCERALIARFVPGTMKERGLSPLTAEPQSEGANREDSTGYENSLKRYDIPFTEHLLKIKWTKYIPICPSYKRVELNTSNMDPCPAVVKEETDRTTSV